MYKKYCLILIAFLSGTSYAEDPANMQLAERLVEKLNYSQQIKAYKKECYRNTSLLTAEELANENPGYFDGITPSSKYWPLVQKAYEEFNRTGCDFFDESDFLGILTREYSGQLSLDELQQVLSFYDTEMGRKLIKADVAASAKLQELVSSRYAAQVKTSQAEFAKKLAAIKAKTLHDQADE